MCSTLCDPMDCRLPGSSVCGILQASVLEWVAISFSRGSSWPRDRTRVSHIVGRHFTFWATREATKPLILRPHALKESSYLSFIPSYHVFTHSLRAVWRKMWPHRMWWWIQGQGNWNYQSTMLLRAGYLRGLFFMATTHTIYLFVNFNTKKKKRVESTHRDYCHIGKSQKLSRQNNLRCIQRHFTLLKYPLCSWFLPSWKSLYYRQNINMFIKISLSLHYRYQCNSFID